MRRCHVFGRIFSTVAAGMIALPAFAFDTTATSAYVVDLTTNTVLMEKNAQQPLPPASMSKLMTLNMLFEALDDGRVSLETRFPVSQRAMDMGGSTMFLTTADRPTVEELIKGIIVLSGNDACVVVAEGLGGTEEAFARMMTERAQVLGMDNSTFGNASGWPHPMQRMSMEDLAILAERLIEEFPQYYNYFSISEFPYDGRAPDNRFNRNPLLKLGMGADGLKTGHTQEAGYGLVGSAREGNRRVVMVLSGMDSETTRRNEAASVINWAFRQFALKSPVEAGTVVAEVPVFLGSEDTVGLAPASDLEFLMPVTAADEIDAEVTWRGPIEAPIMEGQELGKMIISRSGLPEVEVPLVAARNVEKAGFAPRFAAAAGQVFDMALDIAGRGDSAPEAQAVSN